MSTHPLKHTIKHGLLYSIPDLTEESFKKILQNRTALLELTEQVMARPFRLFSMCNGTNADRDRLDMMFKHFIKDCIEGGASIETMVWLDNIGETTFEPCVNVGEYFIKGYWEKINLRRLKQEQKELKKATTRSKAQRKVML